MLSIVTKLISSLFSIVDKVMPSGEDKLKFKEKLFEIQAKLRNNQTIDNITYIVVINWFGLTPFKLHFIENYFDSVLFLGDIISFGVAISFQFGIETKNVVKPMLDERKKKRSQK